ncbi:MAG: sigma-54-dependent Fis family transcriptional regulator [Deltaproteobacteria bacterium]|nr:sigma-54-dependent Fis family transcriptional regulator [Deltaproteobacteria bacterium]
MASVLIIDDDRVFCDVLSRAVNQLGHHTSFSLSLKDGLDMADSREFDVIMLDVQLPDGNGIEAIPLIRETASPPEVIIITGSGDPDGAELSIKCGAWDYIEKPASVQAMTLPLIRALEYRKEKSDKKRLTTLDRKGIVGESVKMRSCLDLAAQAANSDVNALITGETGTGKELFAKAIHLNSARAMEPFIVVDCGAIPEAIVESLLFGHEKGSFTGAEKSRIGLIKHADGGTLFLDEVGELPLSLQKAFLRVLQEHRFRPIGSKTEHHSNFRLVAATNRHLEEMVKEGKFREDLLYRLQSFIIHLPPLRERPEDIMDLVMYHAARICENSNIMTKGFSPDFFEILRAYHWPGNVRELFNAVHSALTTAANEPVLYPRHLPVQIRAKVARENVSKEQKPQSHKEDINDDEVFPINESLVTYKDYRTRLLENGEKRYFTTIASMARGNVKEACQLSGLSKSRLYYFLKKYGISLSGNGLSRAKES